SNTVKDNYYIRVSNDFNIEKSPFEVYNKIDNFFIILAENISRNEINEYLKDAQEKLVLKIIK
ncbi:MAG: homoserine dehydrogenase, partial [Fusobacterium periodonticum]|nr:homoserine dehydrogenase [Fusobacterium periodonticum]